MTVQLFANNAKTTLAAPINGTQTTITVAPGTGVLFPNPSTGQAFKVTLVSASSSTVYEICLCTARSTDTLTVVRGQEGTSGTPFLLNDIVGNYDTAAVMTDLVQSEQLQSGYYSYADVGGTANALTATIGSALTTIPDGLSLVLGASTANTGAVSLVLTLGSTIQSSYPIVKGNNQALVAGDIPSQGYPMQINWSPEFSAYVLQNPATGIFVAAVPTGAIVQFPAITAPTGYLVANGQLVSRTTYGALWTFAQASGNLVSDATWIGGQYGSFSSGDGSTTFRLPQFGGYFLRCLDNGNGIDPSRAIGTVQQNQNQTHTHTTSSSVSDSGHSHTTTFNQTSKGNNATPYMLSNPYVGENFQGSVNLPSSVSITGISVNTTVNSSGGSESRPVNIAVLTCIKY
jgi:microcystin-dependent protein